MEAEPLPGFGPATGGQRARPGSADEFREALDGKVEAAYLLPGVSSRDVRWHVLRIELYRVVVVGDRGIDFQVLSPFVPSGDPDRRILGIEAERLRVIGHRGLVAAACRPGFGRATQNMELAGSRLTAAS